MPKTTDEEIREAALADHFLGPALGKVGDQIVVDVQEVIETYDIELGSAVRWVSGVYMIFGDYDWIVITPDEGPLSLP